tara:strand:- start:495 stop:911 length:417 start_codon:yes stop_codon:yes gene_type:complete
MVLNSAALITSVASFAAAAIGDTETSVQPQPPQIDLQEQNLYLPENQMAFYQEQENPHSWAYGSVLGQDSPSPYSYDRGYDWATQAPEDGTTRFDRFSNPAEAFERRCGRAILRSSYAKCEINDGIRISIPTHVPGRH